MSRSVTNLRGEAWGPRPGGRRHLDRRVLLISFTISFVVHGAVIVLYPVVMRSLRPALELVPWPGEEVRPSGTEIVILLERPAGEEAPVSEPRPERRREPERPPSTMPRPAGPALPEAEVARKPAPTAADVLRPTLRDPRLWRPTDEAILSLTPEERMRIRLYVKLEALNDSLAAEADAAARATDWTVADADGNRWGVSPGQLHLGKITLPLPVGFVAAPGKREEAEQRLRDFSEIERAAASAHVQEVWKERAKAIRERKDRERRERQAADTAETRPPPP